MVRLSNITFTGESGKTYKFIAYSLDTNHKNIGAVYIFTKRTGSEGNWTHKPLYIGESGELADRLSNHEKWGCLEDKGVNCLCTHIDDNETSRLEKETDLRRKHKPPCNEQ